MKIWSNYLLGAVVILLETVACGFVLNYQKFSGMSQGHLTRLKVKGKQQTHGAEELNCYA